MCAAWPGYLENGTIPLIRSVERSNVDEGKRIVFVQCDSSRRVSIAMQHLRDLYPYISSVYHLSTEPAIVRGCHQVDGLSLEKIVDMDGSVGLDGDGITSQLFDGNIPVGCKQVEPALPFHLPVDGDIPRAL